MLQGSILIQDNFSYFHSICIKTLHPSCSVEDQVLILLIKPTTPSSTANEFPLFSMPIAGWLYLLEGESTQNRKKRKQGHLWVPSMHDVPRTLHQIIYNIIFTGKARTAHFKKKNACFLISSRKLIILKNA